jgi:hypothetical protein
MVIAFCHSISPGSYQYVEKRASLSQQVGRVKTLVEPAVYRHSQCAGFVTLVLLLPSSLFDFRHITCFSVNGTAGRHRLALTTQ